MTPLMTAKEVGEYLRVSSRQVTERLILVKSFPRPVRLPTPIGTRGLPKWKPEEIAEWVDKFKA